MTGEVNPEPAEAAAPEPVKQNVGAELLDAVQSSILEAVSKYVSGTEEDLARFGRGIAMSLVPAIASGDPMMLAEIRGQAAMLAEMNRIRARAGMEAVAKRVLEAAVEVAGKLAASFVKSLVPGGFGVLLKGF